MTEPTELLEAGRKEHWLIAFREWSASDAAPQFPSRQEEMEAEAAFRAGWDAGVSLCLQSFKKYPF